MIELKNVDKVYEDGFQALKDINLEFEEGKINVLIGPSGCGKTTTMKLINRLVEYTSGQVNFDGTNIQELNPIELRRKIGFVIQNIGLFPHMTIFNNVATVPKLLKWDKERIRKQVVELLEMVNLDPETYMNRYPSELSGGQQQRIGVIRALAAEPSTILMDEPFSALDPISREQLQNELLRLQSNINKTIIFVTHDMDEALKIADQIILMKDGQVVQRGTPKEILDQPANDFVKEFIGEKRLGKQSLPALDELIVKEFISLTETTSNEAAVTEMATHNVSEAMVVDESGNLLGIISLYDALTDRSKTIGDLLNSDVVTIKETERTEIILNRIVNPRETIPVLSRDDKLVGVLDTSKIFQSLNDLNESQSGGF